ncbi:MAG TPA: FAD-binding oxidoreductase [Baekduia sp.]|nr:FAD-binding oxidoreductase [Baekduia sp.]
MAITRLDPATTPFIVRPADDDYDAARAAWNLAVDQRPAGVVPASTVAEVVHAVRYARDHGLRIAPQTTGHLASALPMLEDTLLLRTQLEGGVVVDPGARTARARAGALAEDVVLAAAEHGLAPLHGSSPDVGVVGYHLGGGVGYYGRTYGLAANHVVGFDIVTADGLVRRVDAQHDPALFWALRGGGGNFGVVTAIELRLFEIADAYAGTLFWPIDRAAEIARAWRDWTATAPEAATTNLRILCLPPLPDVPEPLRAVPHVAIDGAVLGDEPHGRATIAALRAIAGCVIDTFAQVPAPAVLRIHGDPEQPVPNVGDHLLLRALPDDALDAFLAVTGPGSGSPLLAAELRHLGGAFARTPEGAGARGALEGQYALFGVGLPMTPELGEAVHATLRRLVHDLAPWSTGTIYLNFGERGGSARHAFAPADFARLQHVRAAYDPDEVFVASHRIAPA